MVKYQFLNQPRLPALEPCLYEYVVASNGLFVRAKRKGMSAMVCVQTFTHQVAGLYPAMPYLDIAPVNEWVLQNILKYARDVAPLEKLWWLLPVCHAWGIYTPEQIASAASVRPVDPYHPRAVEALVEIHSHHRMPAFFSDADDRDETGFKVYAVLGYIHHQPTLRVRVGIYGHFMEIPAEWVFDLPDGIECAQKRDMESSYAPSGF